METNNVNESALPTVYAPLSTDRSCQLLLVSRDDLSVFIKQSVTEVFEELVHKQEEQVKKRQYTRQEVADILHVTLPTIDAMVKRGQIRCEKIGRRVLFNAIDIDAAIAGNKLYRYKRYTR